MKRKKWDGGGMFLSTAAHLLHICQEEEPGHQSAAAGGRSCTEAGRRRLLEGHCGCPEQLSHVPLVW